MQLIELQKNACVEMFGFSLTHGEILLKHVNTCHGYRIQTPHIHIVLYPYSTANVIHVIILYKSHVHFPPPHTQYLGS